MELEKVISQICSQDQRTDLENDILTAYDKLSATRGELSDSESLLLQSLLLLRESWVTVASAAVKTSLLSLSIEQNSPTWEDCVSTWNIDIVPGMHLEPAGEVVEGEQIQLHTDWEILEQVGSEDVGYNIENYDDIHLLDEEVIEAAKTSLEWAAQRLLTSKAFRVKFGYNKQDVDILVSKYFPLMVKESFLDFEAVSNSWALWYFQLRSWAITDAKAYLKRHINKNKTYDENIPEDNCILGIIYFETRYIEIQNKFPGITDWDAHDFSLFAYNAWLGSLLSVIEYYRSEEWNWLIAWESFASWISQEIWAWWSFNKKQDSVYWGNYKDWFWWEDFSGDADAFIEWEEVTNSKIFEAVNYVEKIRNISEYSLIHSDHEHTEEWQELQDGEVNIEGENIEYLERKIIEWEWIISLVRAEWLNIKFTQSIFDFNKQNNPAFWSISDINSIPPGTIIFIPLWSTWFYTNVDVKPPVDRVEVTHDGIFNFYEWLESIEVLSDELKGKVFVLDPGHGWPDLWAHPIARNGDGNPIEDTNSAVKYISDGKTQRVRRWEWSDYLHVYESMVVVDIAYRMALMLRERWADVYITRYNKTTGIIDQANMTTPDTADDIYSDTWESWEYSRDGNKIRLRRGVEIANAVLKESWVTQENIFFFSLHADAQAKGLNLPIIYKYYDGRSGVSPEWRNFARELASNTQFRWQDALADGQGLYIVHPGYNEIQNALLIEIANMNDPWSAYILRQPGSDKIRWRQQVAEALVNGLLETFSKD